MIDSKLKNIAIERIGRPYLYNGYVFGYRTKCLRYRIKLYHDKCRDSCSISDFLELKVESSKDAHFNLEKSDACKLLLTWVGPILKKAGHPVFESARQLNFKSVSSEEVLILQPCYNPTATLLVVDFVIDLINELSVDFSSTNYHEHWNEKFDKLIHKLKKTALRGFNPIHLLSAAHELDIPWLHLHGNIFQLGTGHKARWIDSSLTDRTPTLSTNLARNKAASAALLREAGLPVPRHFFAANSEAAVKHAELLGYPVVVKPADLDGGVGVKANLHGEDAVRKAFDEARKVSNQILVEKHVPGRDYRLQIVNGEVQGIIERIPAGVTGNGTSTVLELVTEQNNLRKNAQDDRRYLHQITNDDESTAQLSLQDLHWQSIPQHGYFVRLRGAANIASGGVPVIVEIDEAHPDNLALTIRAVRILKLDVAGVDLLIPDIRQSWLESNAYICEINAQPQMFTTMHKPMLASFFSKGGSRIPIVVHLTTSPTENDVGIQMHRNLYQRGLSAGLVHGDKLWLSRDCIRHDVENVFSGTRMLSCDQAVEAIVISCNDISFLQQGWPVDRCDVLIIESLPSVSEKEQSAPSITDWLNSVAGLGLEVLMAPKSNRTEILHILNSWNPPPLTILSNFSDSKEVNGAVERILVELNKKSAFTLNSLKR